MTYAANNEQNSKINQPKSQENSLKLPPINQKNPEQKRLVKLGYSSEALESPRRLDSTERRGESSLSQESSRSKKIIKWHVWWDKSRSDVRVPSYPMPSKHVPSKIGSLERINHRPGGGNVNLLDEKLHWKKSARIDHLAKGYVPGGGNRKILNEKLSWKTSAKIGSLENVKHAPGGGNIAIIDQPFNKNGIKPRIDSGFIYEEVYVPVDYVIKPTPRTPSLEVIYESYRSNQKSIKN